MKKLGKIVKHRVDMHRQRVAIKEDQGGMPLKNMRNIMKGNKLYV